MATAVTSSVPQTSAQTPKCFSPPLSGAQVDVKKNSLTVTSGELKKRKGSVASTPMMASVTAIENVPHNASPASTNRSRQRSATRERNFGGTADDASSASSAALFSGADSWFMGSRGEGQTAVPRDSPFGTRTYYWISSRFAAV